MAEARAVAAIKTAIKQAVHPSANHQIQSLDANLSRYRLWFEGQAVDKTRSKSNRKADASLRPAQAVQGLHNEWFNAAMLLLLVRGEGATLRGWTVLVYSVSIGNPSPQTWR